MVQPISLDKATHTYSPALPSVCQILQECGMIDATWFTDEARDRGTRVHTLSEEYDLGTLDWSSVIEDDLGYLRSYIAFRFRHPEMKFDWIELPQMDALGLYAGTTDRMIIQRPKHIWDIKSGMPFDWHSIQLAAYANLDGDPYAYERHCIYLDRDGKDPKVITYPKSELAEDLADWNSCLRIYYRKLRGKKLQ
jgi:hypothetical protein